jgi:hypothetical protein
MKIIRIRIEIKSLKSWTRIRIETIADTFRTRIKTMQSTRSRSFYIFVHLQVHQMQRVPDKEPSAHCVQYGRGWSGHLTQGHSGHEYQV